MNLYVWDDPYHCWFPGVIFAHAKDLRSARREVLKIVNDPSTREVIKKQKPMLIKEQKAFIYPGGD